jgi:hypothetical protein
MDAAKVNVKVMSALSDVKKPYLPRLFLKLLVRVHISP